VGDPVGLAALVAVIAWWPKHQWISERYDEVKLCFENSSNAPPGVIVLAWIGSTSGGTCLTAGAET
jgi:hypothetical protein